MEITEERMREIAQEEITKDYFVEQVSKELFKLQCRINQADEDQ